MILDINGIKDTEGTGKYWGIDINGESAPFGIGSNAISTGDYITFNYGSGSGTPEYIVNITVGIEPNLSIISPLNMTTGSSAIFTALSSFPENTVYTWDFGDSTKAVETKASGVSSAVEKTYTTTGIKTISVTAVSEDISIRNTVTISVTTPPAAFNESSGILANLAGISVPDTTQISFTGTDVTDLSNITISISRYQNYSSITDDDWVDIQANYTIPNTNEKPLLILEIDSSNADGVNNIHQLSNYARLTVRLSIDSATASNVSFYRYVSGSNSYEQLNYTKGLSYFPTNGNPSWAEFLVDIPGFSTIIAAVDEIPKDARATVVLSGGTPGGQPNPQPPTISYRTITVNPGSFTYTTTMDGKSFIVDRMSVFGILDASGMAIQTKGTDYGIYIHSIDGMAAQDGTTNGWMYQVNGIAPGQGASNYITHDGDKIIWYYSDSMEATPSTSTRTYGFTVKVNPGVVPTAVPQPTLSPAKTPTINLGVPNGVTVSSGTSQTITVDTLITQAGSSVIITEDTIIITTLGLQMTIQVKNLRWADEIATADIQSVTTKLSPASSLIQTAGIVI
ncbi:MAG TPA: DUF4430 domain-containing protein [Methanocorpusculum sp.]|nr:DUF4430 domain-containing protein [Methanocorpusculum sp.]